jgi:transposase
MARLYGRCARDRRCVSSVPHGHWQSSTFIAALRVESITAPFLIEGAVNAEVFTAYLQQVLCPELHAGDVVILDNLSTHKIPSVASLIMAQGASVRYLPAYSPDLNPIEMAFAKLKAHLRQAAARNLSELQTALAQSLPTFSAAHCRGFFRHAHYASI